MTGRGRGSRAPPPPMIIEAEAGPGPATEELEQQTTNSTRGSKCEIKQLDGRYDHLGNYNVTDSAVNALAEGEEAEPHAEFALVSTRVYGVNGLYQSTQLEIKSRLIKRVLRKVIKYYPGQPVDTAEIILNDPPKPLFHYRTELEDYMHTKADEETKKHLALLFKFVDALLGQQVERYKDLRKRGLCTFNLIWMLFRPGDLVYTEKDGQPIAYMVQKVDSAQSFFRGKYWSLTCVGTNYNGTKIGRAVTNLQIYTFDGTREITSLNAYPFSYHKEESKMKHRLIKRGERFLSLQGWHHMDYKGMAHVLTDGARQNYDDDDTSMDGERLFQTAPVNGRIMVDAATFSRINPSNRIRFEGEPVGCDCASCRARLSPSASAQDPESGLPPAGVSTNPDDHQVVSLTDKDTMLCPPFVLGFSLQSKKWCRFFIDQVEPVKLNTKAFDQLIINPAHKELVLAMVEAHVGPEDDSFDDIIAGKGRSLIILLHGAPGVGKTLTAESIADHTERPLYMVSSGELGTHPQDVEATLTNILDIATTWKAVVLLDEADVFLQQRSGGDIDRNALVSVFLKLLEYFNGILFLTSNRVAEFDTAFKSRIHVALNYPELSQSSRRQVWREFLLRMPPATCKLDLENDLNELELEKINGRQIKNAVKTAAALARKKGEKLQLKHLEVTLGTIRQFENDFAKSSNFANGYAASPAN